MARTQIFIVVKKYQLFNLIKEIIEEYTTPTCNNCGEDADYFLHGSWVCLKCYPHGKWNTQEFRKKRERRLKSHLDPHSNVNRKKWMDGTGGFMESKKANGGFKFTDYKWMSTMAGFNYPVDVHYGTVYLGILFAEQDGYVIDRVSLPNGGMKQVQRGGINKFKSANLAAEALHRLWKMQRTSENV